MILVLELLICDYRSLLDQRVDAIDDDVFEIGERGGVGVDLEAAVFVEQRDLELVRSSVMVGLEIR